MLIKKLKPLKLLLTSLIIITLYTDPAWCSAIASGNNVIVPATEYQENMADAEALAAENNTLNTIIKSEREKSQQLINKQSEYIHNLEEQNFLLKEQNTALQEQNKILVKKAKAEYTKGLSQGIPIGLLLGVAISLAF